MRLRNWTGVERCESYKSSATFPKVEQDRFWSVVRECVRRFHVRKAASALANATRFRKKVNDMPVEQMDLFYHAEPFDVACNIAGQPLDVRDHLEDYLEIRDGATHRAATLARSK